VAVAVVDVQVKGSGAARELQKVNAQAKQLDASVKGVGRSAASATANIQRFGIAFRSVIGPIVAITGAVNLVSRSLNVLGERQADVAALENGLKKIGATSATLDRLTESADRLGKATLFNEEDFTKGFALLTSFQSIGVASYERVAQAAADVAQVTRQDVGSSLLQLAKALQDPVLGLTALARSGTQFSEQQKEQIKALVKNNELLQAQDFILREIEKQYGNAANAAGSAGYAGAVDSLQESFRDFQERLAAGVQPAVTAVLGSMAQLFDVVSKIPAPIGQAALAIGGATAGLVALNAAIRALLASRLAGFIGTQVALMRAFGVQIYATAAAQGALTAATKAYQAAVVAAPWALAAVGIGLIISETYKAIAAQAEYNRVLNEAPLDEVNKKIGELREQLTQATIESQKAAVGMSLMGGSAEFSTPKIAQLNTQLAELVSRQRELALYQQAGVTPQAGFYGPGFAAPPAAPKTVPTAPTGKKGKGRESKLPELTRALALAQSQFDIQGRILQARLQENQALETTRQTQLELSEISSQIAGIEADKNIPNAEKLQQIAALELKAKSAVRQLAFDLGMQDQERLKNATEIMQQLTDEQALIQAKLDGNEAEVMLNQQIRDLKKQFPALNEDDARTVIQSTNALKKQLETADQMKQVYADIGSTIKSGVVDAITSAVDGTKTLGEVANNMLRTLANRMLDIAINMALFGVPMGTGTGGGLFGGFFREKGGPVAAGSSYVVGERGPELFTPGRSGNIAPTGSFGGSNIVVNVDASGSSVQGDANDSKRLGEAIGVAVRQELIKQKRPGGLLA
jgi:hypothetical protein